MNFKQKIINELRSGIVINKTINLVINKIILAIDDSPVSFNESDTKSPITVIAITLNKSDICSELMLNVVKIKTKSLIKLLKYSTISENNKTTTKIRNRKTNSGRYDFNNKDRTI